MKSSMTFEERAKIGREVLANQKPVTLEIARAQAERIRLVSQSKEKKTK